MPESIHKAFFSFFSHILYYFKHAAFSCPCISVSTEVEGNNEEFFHFTFSEGFTIKHLDFFLTSATIMYASKAYSFNRSVPPVFLHQFQKDRFQSLANQNTSSNHEDNHTRATYLVLRNNDKSRREQNLRKQKVINHLRSWSRLLSERPINLNFVQLHV